ncbi:TIGR00282 family metallophosphoesterase [Parvularcula sp. LCG005]|uniref:TIGR00282 family metallophosphoesterase n=1 Tax=Parvularcula sp. LCG005 TaxID=3078805 RepID=UPI002941C873|nr:TIGR00282 family metallophosphoesterase [Parvularcula sp. LCG005]WOI53837.1 TIGR00282 family metallophosphoesterase [Parvularcula sp. LCG005]
MRLLFLGDIMGRTGRTAVAEQLPGLRKAWQVDFVIANAENAAGGFGVTGAIAHSLFEAGVDCITTGNHAFDQKDDISFFDDEPRMLRPANFPRSNPGRGAGLYFTKDDRRVLVIQLHGQRFMNPMDDMIPALEREMSGMSLGHEADAIVVDVHAEATSEKYVIGHYMDGRVSLVCGSHTHVPTADVQVLPGGTAFQADAGMCGDYDSVIGMEKHAPIENMVSKIKSGRMVPASGEATICGIVVDTDDRTGLSTGAWAVRVGGRLAAAAPPAKG